MVMVRSLVKVGNREVKKRYIGNKLIFEDLGDKTDTLSGEEIFTDKADDDSVVHVEIDGKSVQEGEPTPDYPIEIHSLNDFDVVSSVGGRNYWALIKEPWYAYLKYLGNGVFTNRATSSSFAIFRMNKLEVPVGETYTASFEINVSDDAIQFYHDLFYVNEDSPSTRHNRPTLVKDKWVKVYATFDYMVENTRAVHIYISGIPSMDSFQIRNFQLEKGTTATPYSPAIEDITENDSHLLIDKINLSLNEPLRSVGDVRDRLFRDSDGLWKIERNVGEATFDGTEEWGVWHKRDTSSVFGLLSRNLEEPMLKTNGLIVSNMFPSMNVNAIDEEGIFLGTAPRLRVRAFYERIGTTPESTDDEKINSFKQWLSNAYTEGFPLTIVYEVEVPTIQILDQELQDKLNNLRSFQDSNYVYTVINEKTDIISENLEPTLHATFKSKGWYDYYQKTLLK